MSGAAGRRGPTGVCSRRTGAGRPAPVHERIGVQTWRTDIRRVGMLFSGGPAPAANAVISAAALSFLNAGIEVIGFLDGYEDLERFSRGRAAAPRASDYLRLTRDMLVGHPVAHRTSSCARRARTPARR